MRFHTLDLVLAAIAAPGRSPAETLAFIARRAAIDARRDLAGADTNRGDAEGDTAGFELGFSAALREQ